MTRTAERPGTKETPLDQVGGSDVASRVAHLAREVLGRPLPVALRGWDGSRTGPAEGPVVVLRGPAALRRLVWSPSELGLAQAYIAGDLDVEGDLGQALSTLGHAARATGRHRPAASAWPRLARAAMALGAVGPRPAAPLAPARLDGSRHSRTRDRAAIAYHYDLSNDFYRLLLDDSMAYSSGYWTSDAPEATLARAQQDKLDLVCRKLGLRAGQRLLDVGCGWGSLLRHAAANYGVRATGVTLSARQHRFVTERTAAEGLADRVEVRLADYREIPADPDDRFDAIASIEMGEHVGERQYPGYAATLHRLVRPGGRVLIQQMSRHGEAPGGGAFIESYVAPDMHMRPVAATLRMFDEAGLEVRDVEAMREHYPRTVRAWLATLEARWDEAVELVGEPTARVWRLYLAGGALAFEEGRMGVDQLLFSRPAPGGDSGMPPTRPWALPPRTADRQEEHAGRTGSRTV